MEPPAPPPPAEFIVYACPTGPLAEQIARYMEASRAACGPNAAHRYMPHCTLTGFFHDQPDAAGVYIAALDEARSRLWPRKPAQALRVLGIELSEDFHGLLLDGPWLKELVADFARRAHSPTRRDALRLKSWLHLSLAYDFPAAQHEALVSLAQQLVNPAADVAWELRLYQRQPGNLWVCHASWAL